MHDLSQDCVAFLLRQACAERSVVEFPFWRWSQATSAVGPIRPLGAVVTHVGSAVTLGHGYTSVPIVTTGYAR